MWWVLSLRIGTFGFLKEFRPEDPYITQYLVGPIMNLTEQQVNQEVFPIATYFSLIEIVFVFLLTDFLCYKPVIVVNALSGVISQAFLIWGRGLFTMQVMEVFYATMSVSEVAYYTYIYVKVDKEHYQAVTSHVRAATLIGRFTSAVTSQALLYFDILTIADLNHLTFFGMCCALLWAFTLPGVDYSLYFHRISVPHPVEQEGVQKRLPKESTGNYLPGSASPAEHSDVGLSVAREMQQAVSNETTGNNLPDSASTVAHSKVVLPVARVSEALPKWKQVVLFLLEDVKAAYTNLYVLKMCVFISLATCGFNLMMTYVQILWLKIGGKEQESLNGGIEAMYTLISASATLAFSQVRANWSKYGEAVLGVLAIVQGALLMLSARTDSMVIAYAVYVVFGTLHNIGMVLTSSEVATHLQEKIYALVFGINIFFSLLLQTVITRYVTYLGEFPIRDQFFVYGGFFALLGLLYATIFCCTMLWAYYRVDQGSPNYGSTATSGPRTDFIRPAES